MTQLTTKDEHDTVVSVTTLLTREDLLEMACVDPDSRVRDIRFFNGGVRIVTYLPSQNTDAVALAEGCAQ